MLRNTLRTLFARLRTPRTTPQPIGDALAWWEKLPLALLMLSQAWPVTRWYIGDAMPADLTGIVQRVTVAFGIIAGLSLDAAVVTTTMGRRAGRNSGWSHAAALAAAVFSALVALDVYGVRIGPWLHVAFPVVMYLFVQHLSVSRAQTPAADAQVVEQLRAERDAAVQRVEEQRQQLLDRAQEEHRSLAQAEQLVRDLKRERDDAVRDLRDTEQALRTEQNRPRTTAATADDVLAHWRRLQTEQGLSSRAAAQQVGVGESTLRSWAAARNGHAQEVGA